MAYHITKITACGLFGRLNIEQSFRDGINILHGKNGSGKTTLLHILANVLNGDFARFAFLQFDRIEVRASQNRFVTLIPRKTKDEGTIVSVETETGIHTEISEREVKAVEQEWEERVARSAEYPEWPESRKEPIPGDAWLPASYFPAFRTMIEAWSAQNIRYPRHHRRGRRLGVTSFARELFGRFVPRINFASPQEIELDLTERIEKAFLRLGRKDQLLLSKAFSEILPTISPRPSQSGLPSLEIGDESMESLLDEIRALIEGFGEYAVEQRDHDSDVYGRLRESVQSFQIDEASQETTVRILRLYRDLLQDRAREQKQAFEQIEKYFGAVNDFLEGKKLEIVRMERRRSLAGIKFDDGHVATFRALSSGERQILTMIYAATEMSEQDVILIDEPELSLHVDWQRRLMRKMSEQVGGRQIIACTHAPAIAADYDERMSEIYPKRFPSLGTRERLLFDEEEEELD